jgi:hypothetical protein
VAKQEGPRKSKVRKAAKESLARILQVGENPTDMLPPKRLRSLKKLGVTSLVQSIALKDDRDAHWNTRSSRRTRTQSRQAAPLRSGVTANSGLTPA